MAYSCSMYQSVTVKKSVYSTPATIFCMVAAYVRMLYFWFPDEEIISEEDPSISSELEEMLQDMKDSLFKSISAPNFLDILGKDHEKFELGYSEYVNNVRKIEACICQYVEVCTP